MQLQSNFVDGSFNLSCLLVRFSSLVLNLDFIMNNLFCYQSEKPNYNKSDAKSLPKINIIKPFFYFLSAIIDLISHIGLYLLQFSLFFLFKYTTFATTDQYIYITRSIAA